MKSQILISWVKKTRPASRFVNFTPFSQKVPPYFAKIAKNATGSELYKIHKIQTQNGRGIVQNDKIKKIKKYFHFPIDKRRKVWYNSGTPNKITLLPCGGR